MSDDVKYGIIAIGKRAIEKHVAGKRLTYKNAGMAKCYECNAGYTDGRFDCRIPDCPLHPFMPYRGKEPSEEAGDSENEGLEGVIAEDE